MTPPLVLSCGDPAGIGPELAAKAWALLKGDLPFAWIGDPSHLPAGTPVAIVDTPADATAHAATALPVLAHPFPAPARPGQPDPANAPAVIEVLDRAVDLVQSGAAGGLCTAPINKKVLIDGAGFAHPGHTEYLAARAGVDRVVMMLAGPDLRVVPATIHIALADVPRALTPDLLRETIEITARDLRTRFGLPTPRIAIAGLNPHAGEGGAMGHEELDWIAGLIATMQAEGHLLTGPHPADTLFHAAARARYDVAIAMYHDQALIPIKTLDFDRGVNVTLGLPFIRTSPDHGTAYDIAGKGIATPTSLVEALKLAHRLASA
ncbi:MAG: 4-hydroxythreonine-4-phosphate dehydrogenase PdxA [Rhodobacteraceae bacterium]|nr:4-hydroxythreonine-4-phosphate dehydrogenase PdxA [Paracoccaceae bacterium]